MNNTMTRKYISDLAVGEVFTLGDHQAAAYVAEGVGTVGNLTRVSYSLHNGDTAEWAMTKPCLTSVYVFNI